VCESSLSTFQSVDFLNEFCMHITLLDTTPAVSIHSDPWNLAIAWDGFRHYHGLLNDIVFPFKSTAGGNFPQHLQIYLYIRTTRVECDLYSVSSAPGVPVMAKVVGGDRIFQTLTN
jgi:hypothetical protein